MERLLSAISSAESKGRSDALQELADGLRAGKIHADGHVGELCKGLCESLNDNNAKVSSAACDVISALTDTLDDPSVLVEHLSDMIDPLADLLGNSRPIARERASEAAMSLMSVVGPTPLVAPMFTKHCKHKNWRVREGVLSLYAAQVLAYKETAYCNAIEVIAKGSEALGDAQPEVRKAAADALGALALQVGLTRVLSQVGERGARPAQLTAIRERLAALTADSGCGDGGAVWASADSSTLAAAVASKDTGDARRTTVAASRVKAPPAASSVTTGSTSSRPGSGAASGGGGGTPTVSGSKGAPAPTRKVAALGESGSSIASSTHTRGSRTSGGLDLEGVSVSTIPFDVAAGDPIVSSLICTHTSPLWRPGVIGFDVDAGRAKPVVLESYRDLQKVVESLCTSCATVTTDWSVRSKELERLRGVIAGGAPATEGFASIIAKIRDPLCVQVQELRSSLVKQACLAASELFATLAYTNWCEVLAEPLVEACLRLTSVSIAVISTSADACIRSVIHNTVGGFHRVLPKLCAGCRSKGAVTRGSAARYLAQALRGWSRPILERHIDEIASTIASLIVDADKTARAGGRNGYWCLAAGFPEHAESVLAALEAKAQRMVSSEEAYEEAQSDAIIAFCEAVATLPSTLPPPGEDSPTPLSLSAAQTGMLSQSARLRAASGEYEEKSTASARARTPAVGVGSGRSVTSSAPTSVNSNGSAAPTPSGSGTGSGGTVDGISYGRPPSSGAASMRAAASESTSAPMQQQGSRVAHVSGGIRLGTAASVVPVPRAARAPSPSPHYDGVDATWPSYGGGGVYDSSGSSGSGEMRSRAEGGDIPIEPHLSALLRHAFTQAQAPTSAHAITASYVHPLRTSLTGVLELLVSLGALDPRSVARAYAERLPPALNANAGGVIPADIVREFAVPNGGTQPLLSDEYLQAPAVLGLARHVCGSTSKIPTELPPSLLVAVHTPGLSGRGGGGGLIPISNVIPELIRVCMRHPHDNVQLDALALLFAIVDACVDVGSYLSDSISDLISGGVPHASSATSSSGFAASDDPVVRVFTVKLADSSGGASVVTVVPVYARLLLRAGANAAAGTGTGTDDSLFSPIFLDVFHLVVAMSTLTSEPHRAVARRVIAALRRAFSAHVLAAATVACLNRAVGLSNVEDGGASGSGLTFKVNSACIMLLLSLLGDAGAADFMLAQAPTLRRFLDCASTLLKACSSTAFVAASGPRLQQYIDQIMVQLWKSDPSSVVRSLLSLDTRDAESLCLACDATNPTGSSSGLLQAFRSAHVALHPPSRALASTPVATAPWESKLASAATVDVVRAVAVSRPGTSSSSGGGGGGLQPHSILSGAAGGSSSRPAASEYAPKPLVAPAAHSGSARGLVKEAPMATTSVGSSGSTSVAALCRTGDADAAAPLPLTKPNLELIREALASGEAERVTRALHFLGRSVDVQPAVPPAPHAAPKALPTVLASIPREHRDDPVFMSLLERVVEGVLRCISVAAGTSGDLATSGALGSVDATLLQTALSVLRKLYRNSPEYFTSIAGSVLQTLVRSSVITSREITTVLDRTIDECMERMPAELALAHCVACIVEAPVERAAEIIAALRALTRFVPRLPPTLLITEMSKARLMETVARAFLSTSTDVRRAVVGLLVALHFALGKQFNRYAEAYLTIPQQKLLAIYIDKEVAPSGVAST